MNGYLIEWLDPTPPLPDTDICDVLTALPDQYGELRKKKLNDDLFVQSAFRGVRAPFLISRSVRAEGNH
jgi:hypothetical protein